VTSAAQAGGGPQYRADMEALERFSALMLTGPEGFALDEAALCVAAHAHPAIDIDEQLTRLDDLAAASRATTLPELATYLWGECGFSGDRRTYYDRENSYLDRVLDRRLGIPISLAILAIEIGRRIGIGVVGIGMPVHFMVRSASDRDAYVDPFSGALLDEDGCARLFHGLTWLVPVGGFSICARLLANLKAIARQEADREGLIWITRLRCLVPGVPDAERAELARLLT